MEPDPGAVTLGKIVAGIIAALGGTAVWRKVRPPEERFSRLKAAVDALRDDFEEHMEQAEPLMTRFLQTEARDEEKWKGLDKRLEGIEAHLRALLDRQPPARRRDQ